MSKTKEKYMTAMLYACSVAEFHSRDFAKAFKLSHNVVTAMHELGLIQKIGSGKYCWIIRRSPLPSDVIAIRKRLTAYNASARQNNGQLTIKPLKRVASVIEPPVQPIEADNESHLTWIHLLLIFAAGILAGGLIATIWK